MKVAVLLLFACLQGQAFNVHGQLFTTPPASMFNGGNVDVVKALVLNGMKNMTPDEKSEVMAGVMSSMTDDERSELMQETIGSLTGEQKMKLAGAMMQCDPPPNMPGHFIDHNWYLLLMLCVVILIFVLLVLYASFYSKRVEGITQHSEAMDEVETFEVALVQNLIPSISVDRHRFRGISEHTNPIGLKFEDISLNLKDGTCILQGVSGSFGAGHMAAIMGPSGAGKTTFMNALCGKATYGTMGGTVYVNGEKAKVSTLKPVMGFVPQDDVVHETLTVRENFYYSARIRNPSRLTAGTIENIVDDVVSVMQVGHIQRSVVGGVEERGISGGQRKRVNVGMELAACPTLLFLDEPTSGLDSTSSLQIIHSLKRMTDLNMTIIMVIHQPRYNLFTMFDDALLLGKGGITVYLGSAQDAKPYFDSLGFVMPSNDNPADWFMDVVSGEVDNPKIRDFRPEMLADIWKTRQSENTVQKTISRQWTRQDDQAVLTSQLNESWCQIDLDGNGNLDEDELRKVLMKCTGTDPDDEVVEEIMHRMGASDQGTVTRSDFVNYLLGMQDIVANDEATERYSDDASERNAMLGKDGKPARTSASGRPGCCRQFRTLLGRTLVQSFRPAEVKKRVGCAVLLLGFAVVIGLLAKRGIGFNITNKIYDALILCFQMPMATVVLIACLPNFQDRPIFWREASSGLNKSSFFFAKVIVRWIDIGLLVILYTALFSLIVKPWDRTYSALLYPCLCLAFASSGWGNLISTAISPANSTMAGVVLQLCINLIFGSPGMLNGFFQSFPMKWSINLLSQTRWTVPMTFLWVKEIAEEASSCIDILEEGNARVYSQNYPYGLDYWTAGVTFTLAQGVVLHLLALLFLHCFNRTKMV